MLAVALAIAGCGGSDKKPNVTATTPAEAAAQAARVRAAIQDLASASRAGDTGKICGEILTERLAKVIASRSIKKDCEAAARASLVSPKETITTLSVTVTGVAARATIKEQNGNRSLLGLVQQNGDWRIDGIRALSKGS